MLLTQYFGELLVCGEMRDNLYQLCPQQKKPELEIFSLLLQRQWQSSIFALHLFNTIRKHYKQLFKTTFLL